MTTAPTYTRAGWSAMPIKFPESLTTQTSWGRTNGQTKSERHADAGAPMLSAQSAKHALCTYKHERGKTPATGDQPTC